MTKYTLHIGTHKTGTTTIQDFFSSNRDAFLDIGVDFPVHGRRVGTQLSQAHRDISDFFRGKLSQESQEIGKIIDIGLSNSEKCLLSCEDFYFCSSDSIVDNMKRYFGADTNIICYFRDPMSHVFSLYKEAIKGHEHNPVDKFIEKQTRYMKSNQFSYYNYEKNWETWERVFKNCYQINYKPMNRDIYVDIINIMKFEYDKRNFKNVENKNASISDELSVIIALSNELHKNGTIDRKTCKKMRQYIRSNEEEILSKTRDSIEWGTINMNNFYETFQKMNPRYSSMISEPKIVNLPKRLNLNHADFLRLFQGSGIISS